MSYYTHYYLSDISLVEDRAGNLKSIYNDNHILEEIRVNLIRLIWGWDEPLEGHSKSFDGLIYDDLYGIERESVIKAFLELSTLYPKLVVDIEGRGEDWDDLFRMCFHNGRYGIRYATLPPYEDITLEFDKEKMYY